MQGLDAERAPGGPVVLGAQYLGGKGLSSLSPNIGCSPISIQNADEGDDGTDDDDYVLTLAHFPDTSSMASKPGQAFRWKTPHKIVRTAVLQETVQTVAFTPVCFACNL